MIPRFEADELGIVTRGWKTRQAFKRYSEHRVSRPPGLPAGLVGAVRRMVDEYLSQKPRVVVQAPEAWQSVVRPGRSEVDMILAAVSEATGSAVPLLLGKRRGHGVVAARLLVYGLVRTHCPDLSINRIAFLLAGRDFSTVASGLRSFEKARALAPIAEWLAHPAIVALTKEGT